MIWYITYQPSKSRPKMWNERSSTAPVVITWISESGWTKQQIKTNFERQFNGVKILAIEAADNSKATA